MANYKKTRRNGRSKRQKGRSLKRNNKKSKKVMRGGIGRIETFPVTINLFQPDSNPLKFIFVNGHIHLTYSDNPRENKITNVDLSILDGYEPNTFTNIFNGDITRDKIKIKGNVIPWKTTKKDGFVWTLTSFNISDTDKMNGRDKLTLPDGSVYEGDIKNGEMNGIGKLTWPNGSVYEGEMKNGEMNGRGKYKWPDGSVYDGEWKDGNMNGWGKLVLPTSQVYDGEWKDGKKHGVGVIKHNGIIRQCKFENGYNTNCTIMYKDNSKYTGEMNETRPHGIGTYTWPSGHVYNGEFNDGKKQGRGKMTYPNGKSYDGEWKDDKRDGKGKLTAPDGSVKEQGEYKDNKFMGSTRKWYQWRNPQNKTQELEAPLLSNSQ